MLLTVKSKISTFILYEDM